MIDKLTTVPCSGVQSRIGGLAPTQQAEVERALLVFLGKRLANYQQRVCPAPRTVPATPGVERWVHFTV